MRHCHRILVCVFSPPVSTSLPKPAFSFHSVEHNEGEADRTGPQRWQYGFFVGGKHRVGDCVSGWQASAEKTDGEQRENSTHPPLIASTGLIPPGMRQCTTVRTQKTHSPALTIPNVLNVGLRSARWCPPFSFLKFPQIIMVAFWCIKCQLWSQERMFIKVQDR